jgi:integrase
VFPATSRSADPRTGIESRPHLDESSLQKAIRAAARLAGIATHVTGHPFRHSFATQLLEAGDDIRTVQALLGHKDVKTTMIYTHVLNRGAKAVRSPLDEAARASRHEKRCRRDGSPQRHISPGRHPGA